jgi:hypothetical protein
MKKKTRRVSFAGGLSMPMRIRSGELIRNFARLASTR